MNTEASLPENRSGYIKLGLSLMSGRGSRIGTFTAIFILAIALAVDLLTLVPILGSLVGIIYWALFSLYLYLVGCGFLNARRLSTAFVSFVAESFPGIQIMPTIFVGTALIILFVRLEDRTGRKLIGPMSKGELPLNRNGVRLPRNEDGVADNPTRNTNLQPLNAGGVRAPEGKAARV